jgi:IS5 family transposase
MGPRHRRPPLRPCVVARLVYLQHTFDLFDEEVVWSWVENPYRQVITGEMYLQNEPLIDPSSLSRWHERMGEAGVEELLAQSFEAAQRASVIKPASIKRVCTTDRFRAAGEEPYLARQAGRQYSLAPRQNYNRLARQVAHYAHACQFKRMRRALQALRSCVERVQRDIERQVERVPSVARERLNELLGRTRCILRQRSNDKNKLYALHAPEVGCISKGAARARYEFRAKVSIVTTPREGLVLGARSMLINPYDGHALYEALEQATILSDVAPDVVFVDRRYLGVQVERVQIWRSGQKRGVTRGLKARIPRGSAIEPTTEHMKSDGKLDSNWLKGAHGNAIQVVLCGAGHNLRLIVNKLKGACQLNPIY